MNIDSIQLLTPDELAKLLKISKNTVYRLVENRQIPFYKVGGGLRFSLKEVEEFIMKNRIEPVNEN